MALANRQRNQKHFSGDTHKMLLAIISSLRSVNKLIETIIQQIHTSCSFVIGGFDFELEFELEYASLSLMS